MVGHRPPLRFHPSPCDDYENGDLMISIIVNFNAHNFKISNKNLYSKWNIQMT